MVCPKCGSQNVTVSTEQTGGKMSGHNRGCLWKFGRICLICCTFGLWLLVGKSKGKGNMKFKNQTVAICQNCGNKWNI